MNSKQTAQYTLWLDPLQPLAASEHTQLAAAGLAIRRIQTLEDLQTALADGQSLALIVRHDPTNDLLASTIESRRGADPDSSYVARLLGADRSLAAGKVAEESAEVLAAAPGSDHQVEEAADVLFHLFALLARDGVDPMRVLDVLAQREGLPPRWMRGPL